MRVFGRSSEMFFSARTTTAANQYTAVHTVHKIILDCNERKGTKKGI